MTITPIQPASGQWKKFDDAKPYPVVIGFAYDKYGRFPMLKRSNEVRSAKNALSLPSGLHEAGYTFGQQFAIEVKEELNLVGLPNTAEVVGVFENISAEDSWHWCLFMVAMQVESLDSLENMEPDKHSDVKLVFLTEFKAIIDDMASIFTPGLREAILNNWSTICRTLPILRL